MPKKKLTPAHDVIDSVIYKKIDTGLNGTRNVVALYDDGDLMVVPTLFLASQDSEASAETYAGAVKSFLNEIKKRNPGESWRDINQRKIQGWLKTLQASGNSPATIINRASALKSYYDFTEKGGWVEDLPELSFKVELDHAEDGRAVEPQQRRINLKENYIERDIFDCLLGQIESTNPFIMERDELVMRLGLLAGLREEEITNPRNLEAGNLLQLIEEAESRRLTPEEDIQISVFVLGKGRNGGKEREVNFGPELTRFLAKFLRGSRERVAGSSGPLICKTNGQSMDKEHPGNVFRSCRDKALLCDLPALQRDILSEKRVGLYLTCKQIAPSEGKHKSGISFHSLRHTYITNLIDHCIKSGLPLSYVQEQAGHEDEEMMKRYTSFQSLLAKQRNR